MMVQHTCDGLTPPELIKDLAGNLLFIVYTPGHKIPAMVLSRPLLGVIKHLMSNTCSRGIPNISQGNQRKVCRGTQAGCDTNKSSIHPNINGNEEKQKHTTNNHRITFKNVWLKLPHCEQGLVSSFSSGCNNVLNDHDQQTYRK